MPTKQVSPMVAAEADRFEAALKSARIPDQLTDGMWDIWTASPARAHSLIARFMGATIGQQVAAKLKQAAAPADVIDMALARYREAAVAAARQGGDEAVAADIERQREELLQKYGQSVAGAGAGRATSSGEGSKVAQKAAPMGALEAAVKGLPIPAVKAAPTTDPYAVALGADQARPERNKR